MKVVMTSVVFLVIMGSYFPNQSVKLILCLPVKYCGFCFQVLQRRNTGKLDFMKRWRQYIAGFGNMTEEFWLGEQSGLWGVISADSTTQTHTSRNWASFFFSSYFRNVCLLPQVWRRSMSLQTHPLSMSWGLTWAWARSGSTLYTTTLRLHQSSKSSNSPLANTEGQQVGLTVQVFLEVHTTEKSWDFGLYKCYSFFFFLSL